MSNESLRRIAFISSYLPRQCGIATFCHDLVTHIAGLGQEAFEPLVVAMVNSHEQQYNDPVKFEIRKNVKNDYVCAADFLNFSHIDLVSVQHEFGLFGGNAGNHLNLLLKRIDAPVVTTLHTVLDDPQPAYQQSMIDVCSMSDAVIVMNHRGIDMLGNNYGINTEKIHLIPHGIPDLPFVDSSYYKHKFGLEGRKTILTFGLLSRNKGIEHMLKAMPAIVEEDPSVLYIVLGATHPNVLKHDGEEYRFELQRIVDELGLQDNVMFHNHFVSDEQLHHFLCAADIYVTPYQNREQLTSGTLAFAVGAGKAVVSTPYWAAEELLSEDRGAFIGFNNTRQLSETIIELMCNETLFLGLRQRAYDYGRTMTWTSVGKRYWDLFNQTIPAAHIHSRTIVGKPSGPTLKDIPEPSLEHLQALTDDTGLMQHATFMLPNRKHGYCTDDNARGIIAMVKYYAQYGSQEALNLFKTYLSFTCHAQREDGTFRNFMDYNRCWQDPEPEHDVLGRSLWAFGTVIANPPLPELVPIMKDLFDKSVRHVMSISPRGKAYAIFGMRQYLMQFPGASDVKRQMHLAADTLVELYQNTRKPDWNWFENILCYDNAVLPQALFEAYLATGNQTYLETATQTSDFLLSDIFTGEHFSFIGCNGWYSYKAKRADYDQQPLEAAGTVMMCRAAYQATDNPNYLKLQKKAFDWFLGENDLSRPVYDFRTKGCSDGLQKNGANLNQGAESMLSFLMALLNIIESYTSSQIQSQHSETMSINEPVKNEKQSHIKK